MQRGGSARLVTQSLHKMHDRQVIRVDTRHDGTHCSITGRTAWLVLTCMGPKVTGSEKPLARDPTFNAHAVACALDVVYVQTYEACRAPYIPIVGAIRCDDPGILCVSLGSLWVRDHPLVRSQIRDTLSSSRSQSEIYRTFSLFRP